MVLTIAFISHSLIIGKINQDTITKDQETAGKKHVIFYIDMQLPIEWNGLFFD